MSQYLELFIEESKEHLQNLNQHLLEIENNPNNMTILNEIFRVAHTVKGMAGTMGFSKIATLTHAMENVLQEVRNGNIKISTHIVDVLFQCLDALENYVNRVINEGNEGQNDYASVVKALNLILAPDTEQVSEQEPKETDVLVEKADEFVNDEYTQNIINKAVQAEMNAYNINITLNAGCVLKAARAFIIFRTLETECDIIKSEPKVEDIEDEKFDLTFNIVVVTKASTDKLEKELYAISEVDNVGIDVLAEKALHRTAEQRDNSSQVQDDMQSDVGVQLFQQQGKQYKNEETQDGSSPQVAKPRTRKTVRVDIDRLDNLMNLVSELIIIKTRLEDIEGTEQYSNSSEAIEYLERITTSLHDAVMKVRMVPVEMVFNRFPRMIRDLARELDKKITLNMYGQETEVDRTVIDEIGDPLIHLLRNSADHGIESTDQRLANNKSEHGTINLKAYHDGNNVVIEVQDDGAGIDVEKVRQKAIVKGVVDPEMAKALSDKEVIDFLFQASFSTADKVTDVSGRGVGLDVVKTKIEDLGGIVEVETKKGKGSKFIIRLPLTLAIIQALMVILEKEKYAIPLSSIKEIINIKPKEVRLVQNKEVILLRDTVIPLIRLDKVLDVPKTESKEQKQLTIVIVRKGDKLTGFVVDSLLGQQEIVIKSLGKHLTGISEIAGATILGDGQVALILDVNALAL